MRETTDRLTMAESSARHGRRSARRDRADRGAIVRVHDGDGRAVDGGDPSAADEQLRGGRSGGHGAPKDLPLLLLFTEVADYDFSYHILSSSES